MVCARALVAIWLGVVLAACGGSGGWRARAAVPQPPTQVIGGIPVAKGSESLPDLTEAELADLVARAEKEMEGLRVRRVIHSRVHPGETPYVALLFEYHETRARIRRCRAVTITWDEEEGAWSRRAWRESFLNAEICAPGRSFLEGKPVPEADVVHAGVGEDMTAEEIVEVVDAVYDHVPEGQKVIGIGREDDGVFEVTTIRALKYRAYSGFTLEVRRERRGWKVTLTGEWVT